MPSTLIGDSSWYLSNIPSSGGTGGETGGTGGGTGGTGGTGGPVVETSSSLFIWKSTLSNPLAPSAISPPQIRVWKQASTLVSGAPSLISSPSISIWSLPPVTDLNLITPPVINVWRAT